MNNKYQDFLATKQIVAKSSGFQPRDINQKLFDFQRDVVCFGLRKGRFASFEDCGLGKTAQQLEWSNQVCKETGGNVLILTPLAVGNQTCAEAVKFGIENVNLCRDKSEIKPGITITNYERLHRFDLSAFNGITLDESSILKSQDGKYRTMLIEESKRIPYRSAWTATPAPNDFMEIGNHAEFLGVMSRSEMLATFFVHDGGDTSKWRLKGHAETDFWRWLCSWAVNIRRPSDLGYSDNGFDLPKLNINHVTVESNCQSTGFLFALPASSLKERRDARRGSLSERVEMAAKFANSNSEQWLIWCDLNDESKALAGAIIGAVEVTGSDDEETRIDAMQGFTSGKYRALVTKPDIAGFGMNWQHSHNAIFCGLSDSYERFYQSLRRQYRFGQQHPVNVHIITSNLEGAVVENIRRKQSDSDRMANEMIHHMASISSLEIRGTSRTQTVYNPQQKLKLPSWLQAA